MKQQTKIELIRGIATLAENLKGTAIATEAEQVLKQKITKVSKTQLANLKARMESELKLQFIRKAV